MKKILLLFLVAVLGFTTFLAAKTTVDFDYNSDYNPVCPNDEIVLINNEMNYIENQTEPINILNQDEWTWVASGDQSIAIAVNKKLYDTKVYEGDKDGTCVKYKYVNGDKDGTYAIFCEDYTGKMEDLKLHDKNNEMSSISGIYFLEEKPHNAYFDYNNSLEYTNDVHVYNSNIYTVPAIIAIISSKNYYLG